LVTRGVVRFVEGFEGLAGEEEGDDGGILSKM
jgi:hypothetical protein